MSDYLFHMARSLLDEARHAFCPTKTRKVLFDHLPECGGASLRAYLRKQYPARKAFAIDNRDLDGGIAESKALPENSRYAYDLILGHRAHELLDFANPECLKLAMFRDPVDRILSHYSFAKENPDHYLHEKIHKSGIELEEYVTSGLSPELENWYASHFADMSSAEVASRPNEALEKAMDVLLNRYDVIGFLEDYSPFVEEVAKQANFRHAYDGRKTNVTGKRLTREDASAYALAKVEQVNSVDVTLYRNIRSAKMRLGNPV